jgi:isoquinoline 1-oxidoreductase subunit alpha
LASDRSNAVLMLHGTSDDSGQLLQPRAADFLFAAVQLLDRLGSCAGACPGNRESIALAYINDTSNPGDAYPGVSNGGVRMAINFKVNGSSVSVDAPQDTPLLWIIREQFKLTGTKFGCGVGLCGACVVHIDGKRAFSCQTQVSNLSGKEVTTIEGLSPDSSHPVQRAWVAERVPQCGYCQSGQIMSAADLLKRIPHPTRAEIVAQMSGHICRCGTYPRILRAIERASRES